MYRKLPSFAAAFSAVMATTGLVAAGAVAQEPDAPQEPGAAPVAAPAAAQARDYSNLQASGVLPVPAAQPVQSVAFSPDGRVLAALTFQQVHLWDTATGTPLKPIVMPRGRFIRALAWSPNGRVLATVGGGQEASISLWDVQTGTMLGQMGPKLFTNLVAFSPDGTLLATGGMDRRVRLWNAETGQELRSFEAGQHQQTTLTFSADGGTLYVVGGGVGKMVEAIKVEGEGDMWDGPGNMKPGIYEGVMEFTAYSVAEGTRLTRVTLNGAAPNVAFSPDGTLLVVAGSRATQRPAPGGMHRLQTLWPADSVRLWRVPQAGDNTGSEAFLPNALQNPNAQPRERIGIAWSPDAKVGVIDGLIWTGGEHSVPLARSAVNNIASYAFSPDGRFLAGGGSGGVQIWVTP